MIDNISSRNALLITGSSDDEIFAQTIPIDASYSDAQQTKSFANPSDYKRAFAGIFSIGLGARVRGR